LTSLVKKLDSKEGLKSFVVYLTDDEKMEDTLKDYATKNGLKHTVLAIDNVAGPKDYKISKAAEVTVLLYNKRKVESNFAFGPGELNSSGVEKVVADLPKIVK
jgi:hypothetical protein